jgi:hypothetical protein
MKLTHLSNQRIIVARLAKVTGTSNRLALSTVTAALGHLQPAGIEKTQLIGGVPGKTYRLFVDGDIDIQEGDQLKDEVGNIYTVRKGGVTRWNHGAMDYLEIFITQT